MIKYFNDILIKNIFLIYLNFQQNKYSLDFNTFIEIKLVKNKKKNID